MINIIILIAALWAFTLSPIFIRYSQLPAGLIVGGRLLISVALLLPFWFRQKHRLADFFSAKFVVAGLALGLHFILWTISVRYTTITAATVAVCTSPVFVVLIERWGLKRPMKPATLSGLAITFAGTVLLFWNDLHTQHHGVFGVLLALVAALLYAIYILIGENVRKKHSLFDYVIPLYFFAAILSFGWSFAQGDNPALLLHASRKEWGLLLGLALIPTILGHTAFNYLVKHFSAYILSVSGLIQPFFCALLALAFLGEKTSLLGWLGGLISIAGVYRVMQGQRKLETAPDNL